MPPVSGIGTSPPVLPPSGGGHGSHEVSAVVPNAGAGQLFSTALAQAIGHAVGGGANSAPHSGGHATSTRIPNGGTAPRHFPIGESSHSGDHGIHETVLGLRAYRQQLIASNIANADTPGYKAVDMDFQEALRIARAAANTPPLTLSATTAGHIAGLAQSAAPPYPLKYHVPLQPSADGNTVDMDVERAKFAENSVMWEFSRDRISGHFKMMMEVLKD